MERGKVKWFNAEKGYGFISDGETHHDIFVHYSAIQADGYRTLNEGDKVEYEAERGAKGFQATSVKKLD